MFYIVGNLLLGDNSVTMSCRKFLLKSLKLVLQGIKSFISIHFEKAELLLNLIATIDDLAVKAVQLFNDVRAHNFKMLVVLLMQAVQLKLFMLVPLLHLLETLLELAEIIDE